VAKKNLPSALSNQRRQVLRELVERLGLDRLNGIKIDYEILDQAFLHPSYCVEMAGGEATSLAGKQLSSLKSNQRLEFLGDAVLGLVAAWALYKDNPNATEGELTKMRAALVCEASLAAAARKLQLGQYLMLGKGIAVTGGAKQTSILADAFEALLAALFLCGAEIPALEIYVFEALQSTAIKIEEGLDEDYKGQLQALVQKTNEQQLTYRILDEQGPDHQKIFLAGAFLDDMEIGRGRGNTKQEAQKQAAKLALHRLKQSAAE